MSSGIAFCQTCGKEVEVAGLRYKKVVTDAIVENGKIGVKVIWIRMCKECRERAKASEA